MKAVDLLNYFLDQAPWVNKDDTEDQIVIGDPEKEIKKLMVVWQASLETVKKAAAGGYDAIMVNEPTFYFHRDELKNVDLLPDGSAIKKIAKEKIKVIEDAGLVIIRNHDVWCKFPVYGGPNSWARQLGFPLGSAKKSNNGGYQNMYEIEPVTALEFVTRVKDKLGADSRQIQFFGRRDKTVSHVGLGTGCACGVDFFTELGCDIIVVCDDSGSYWRDISLAMDLDLPVIRVFHSVSEDYGIFLMKEYMDEHFPDIQTDYLPFETGVSFI